MIKIVGAILCVGLGAAKIVGLVVVLSDPESTRESIWIVKQGFYALFFLAGGVSLWMSRDRTKAERDS